MPALVRENIGAQLNAFDANASANSGAPVLITAAGTGDDVDIAGVSLDVQNYDSGQLCVGYLAALTEDKTLSLTVAYQESADNSTWDTAVALHAAAVVATGGSGGSNERGEIRFNVDLSSKKRYIRFNVKPNLSHTSTDTMTFHAVFTAGGVGDTNVIPADDTD